MPNISVLQAEIDAAAHSSRYPKTVTLTPGIYDVTTTPLVINSRLRVLAHDVEIHVPVGQSGIGLEKIWCSIEGLVVQGPKKHDSSGSIGLLLKGSRCKIVDCIFYNLDVGIELDGDTSNVNGWKLLNTSIWRSTLGVHVHGDNANAGLSMGTDLKACIRSIEENSFLGNTWVATTIHPNTHTVNKPAVNETNENSHSTWLGTYLEGSDPGFSTNSNYAVVVGGYAPRKAVGRADRIGGRRSKVTFSKDPASAVEVTIGQDDNVPIKWKYADGSKMSIRRAGNREGFTEGTTQGMVDRGVYWKIDLNA